MAILPFKVTDFGTNRKLIYDFLLVTHANLPPILHRFVDTAFQMRKSLYLATPLPFKLPTDGFPRDDLLPLLVPLTQCHSWTRTENSQIRQLGYNSS